MTRHNRSAALICTAASVFIGALLLNACGGGQGYAESDFEDSCGDRSVRSIEAKTEECKSFMEAACGEDGGADRTDCSKWRDQIADALDPQEPTAAMEKALEEAVKQPVEEPTGPKLYGGSRYSGVLDESSETFTPENSEGFDLRIKWELLYPRGEQWESGESKVANLGYVVKFVALNNGECSTSLGYAGDNQTVLRAKGIGPLPVDEDGNFEWKMGDLEGRGTMGSGREYEGEPGEGPPGGPNEGTITIGDCVIPWETDLSER